MNNVSSLVLCLLTMLIGFGLGYTVKGENVEFSRSVNNNIANPSTVHPSGVKYSVSLPEDLQGKNLVRGTLIQLDSVCVDSCLHFSIFSGLAVYGDGSEYQHPINLPLPIHAAFDME